MTRDITERGLRNALNRLEERVDSAPEPSECDTSDRNLESSTQENTALDAAEYVETLLSDMSTLQIAKFVAIGRDFDDAEPDRLDQDPDPDRGTPNTDPIIPLSAYSKARAADPTRNVSDADAARLEVLTGGGEWIEVAAEDMAAARQIESEL